MTEAEILEVFRKLRLSYGEQPEYIPYEDPLRFLEKAPETFAFTTDNVTEAYEEEDRWQDS